MEATANEAETDVLNAEEAADQALDDLGNAVENTGEVVENLTEDAGNAVENTAE